MFEQDPELKEIAKKIDESMGVRPGSNPFPVEEAYQESSLSLPSLSDAATSERSNNMASNQAEEEEGLGRIIPDERVILGPMFEGRSANDDQGSVFLSSKVDRQELRRWQRQLRRSTKVKELLQKYFISPNCPVKIRPKGARSAYGLSSIGFEIVNVTFKGGALLAVTWNVPQNLKDLEMLIGPAAREPDYQIFREYVSKHAYNRDIQAEEISRSLSRNVGKIRYFIGQKMKLKRIPELKFRLYSITEHKKRSSLNQLINSLTATHST
eukprot:CAMPEP_0184479790 /NCGR_PEP_ID=MMETSP0113_2-20130426/1374_1 /TAXON_ID=91329 /ORGANISM="Norrisiella sphaerica, Strain BC52" /LENGTH=267 /DNA_ID=CAMNT_0026857941 /DNA_START=263 /DNA_END=1066 /DNA_ORIENTATION=+